MKFKLFDQNANYLPSSFSVPLVKVATVATVATGVSALVDEATSHDQFKFSRMLNRRQPERRGWLQMVKGI